VHLIRGHLRINGIEFKSGDALKVTDENLVTLEQFDAVEVLLFDLPY